MKADWNDAPEYIRANTRKKRAMGMLIPWLIGTSLTVGGLHVAGSAFLKGTVQNLAEKNIQSKPTPIAEITRPEQANGKDWGKIVEEVAARSRGAEQPKLAVRAEENSQSAKQTVFNTNNYIPQGATNIVPATEIYPQQSQEQTPKQQQIVVIGKEPTRLRDYCPHKKGSIESRNCRMQIDLNSRNSGW